MSNSREPEKRFGFSLLLGKTADTVEQHSALPRTGNAPSSNSKLTTGAGSA